MGCIGSKKTTTNSSSTGIQKPILSDDWLSAFKNSAGALNANGANPWQQQGADYLSGSMGQNSPVNSYTDLTNNTLGNFNRMNLQARDQFAPFTTQQAPQSAYAGDVNAMSGADFMDKYSNKYDQSVIDSTVNDYNTNTDRTLNAIRQGRNSSGAFGDRSAIADAAYQGDATRGLGSLVSNLRQANFNTAAGYGQQDASRALTAATSNQSARAANNDFNANAIYKNRDQQMAAINDQVSAISNAVGVSQDALKNVVTADGIDTDKARALFDSGTITQSQLDQIVNLASAGNGQQVDENGNSTSKSSGFDLNPIKLLGSVAKVATNPSTLAGLAALCWVAREVYGIDGPWRDFRAYLLTDAPAWFRALYIKYGERFAVWIKNKPRVKAVIRAWMNTKIGGA